MVKQVKQTGNVQEPEKPADSSGNKGAPKGLFDSALAGQVRDSAQQIWLAGMGAFAKAQAEGRTVFEALVKEGSSLQKQTQSAAEVRLGDVSSKVSSLAGDVSAKAGQQWDKLESIFEERTAKALKRLGVPSASDVAALTARIADLDARLARLAPSAKPTSTAKVRTVAKGVTKAAARPKAPRVAAPAAPAAKRAVRRPAQPK